MSFSFPFEWASFEGPICEPPVRCPSFETKSITIVEFITDWAPITDCSPVGQRLKVYAEPGNAKDQAIILSIFNGISMGTITLVCVKDEPGKWVWESLDGGHRKRAIISYMNNEFSVKGKFYSELSDEERAHFKNFKVSFDLYDPMSKFMKGYIFRSINKTTPVNNQETLNSYGDLPIANAIRETVRVVEMNGDISTPHDFFETTADGNFTWTHANNKRLALEEFVTRFYYRVYDGGDIGSRKFEQLEKMFQNEKISVPKLKKKVDKILDFLLKMAKCKKSEYKDRLRKGEMNTLANLYLWMDANYGSWDLNSPMEFYMKFFKVYSDYYNDPEKKWRDTIDLPFEHEKSSTMTLFRAYAVDQNSYEKQEQLMKWITAGFDLTGVITVKDPLRLFPRWIKEYALQKQGNVCAIDGQPLKWEEAEGAHIVAHADGGRTVVENCAMVRKEHNSAMGKMSVDEYKSVYKAA